jgi:hypothetical protein
MKLRLRYEAGHFIPLDTLPDFKEGDIVQAEIEVTNLGEWNMDALMEDLNRTAGMWADLPEVEGFINELGKTPYC